MALYVLITQLIGRAVTQEVEAIAAQAATFAQAIATVKDLEMPDDAEIDEESDEAFIYYAHRLVERERRLVEYQVYATMMNEPLRILT